MCRVCGQLLGNDARTVDVLLLLLLLLLPLLLFLLLLLLLVVVVVLPCRRVRSAWTS